MRSFVVCYPQRVRESSEQKTPCSLAPGCFGQTGRRRFQHSAACTNTAHIFGELWLIKQMPLMIIFYFSAHLLSLPSRGAWIEILPVRKSVCHSHQSLPSRGAWIEMVMGRPARGPMVSLPSRGAWIEITRKCRNDLRNWPVAPLAGSVDRNVHGPEMGRKRRRRSPRGERG